MVRTERNCFPYRRTPRLEPQRRWRENGVFRGVFRIAGFGGKFQRIGTPGRNAIVPERLDGGPGNRLQKNWRKNFGEIIWGNRRVYAAVVKRIRLRLRDPVFAYPHALARLGPFGLITAADLASLGARLQCPSRPLGRNSIPHCAAAGEKNWDEPGVSIFLSSVFMTRLPKRTGCAFSSSDCGRAAYRKRERPSNIG